MSQLLNVYTREVTWQSIQDGELSAALPFGNPCGHMAPSARRTVARRRGRSDGRPAPATERRREYLRRVLVASMWIPSRAVRTDGEIRAEDGLGIPDYGRPQ